MTRRALRCALRWLLFAAGLVGAVIGLSRGATRAAQATASRTDRITLSIIGTNDLHGNLLPKDGRGGLQVFAGYMSNLRRARRLDAGGVVLIDAGDMFQGTLESNLDEGKSLISAYNALGYAAAAIGNHEFDFGPVGPLATPATPAEDPRGALKARAVEARFPFLAANLIDTATSQPVRWPNVKASTVVEAGGLKVGIVGVMTKNALRATTRLNAGGLRVASLSGTVVREATALRASGVSVVVVAAHAGGRCARFDEPDNLASCDLESSEIVDVARSVSQGLVDVIVAGHTHAGMAHVVNGIVVAEAFSGGRAFSRVDLTVDRTTKRVVAVRSFPPRDVCAEVVRGTARCDPAVAGRRSLVTASYEGAPVVGDAAITALVAPAIERVRAFKAAPLGATLDTPIRRDGAVESPLGNLFADALRESTAADVSINNTDGGLRADLPSGPLTYGRLYEVFPFDNEIVRLTMTGRELRRVVTGQLGRRVPVDISGVQVAAECVAGSLTVTMRRPSGRLVHDQERLLVVTTDYLATGGDGVFAPVMPPNGYDVDEVEPLARDVVVDWFRRHAGHLREDQFVNPTSRRWVYPGVLPVRCGRS